MTTKGDDATMASTITDETATDEVSRMSEGQSAGAKKSSDEKKNKKQKNDSAVSIITEEGDDGDEKKGENATTSSGWLPAWWCPRRCCSPRMIILWQLGIIFGWLVVIATFATLLLLRGSSESDNNPNTPAPYYTRAPSPPSPPKHWLVTTPTSPCNETWAMLYRTTRPKPDMEYCEHVVELLGYSYAEWGTFILGQGYWDDEASYSYALQTFDWLVLDHDRDMVQDWSPSRWQQRLSLAMLYLTTHGSTHWFHNALWMTPEAHECDWESTATSSWLRVGEDELDFQGASRQSCSSATSTTGEEASYTRLFLAENNLVAVLPIIPLKLSRLTTFNLSHNELRGTIPLNYIQQNYEECDWYNRLGLDSCNRFEQLLAIRQDRHWMANQNYHYYFDISNNKLQGEIPLLSLLYHNAFMDLYLHNNDFESLSILPPSSSNSTTSGSGSSGDPTYRYEWPLSETAISLIRRITLYGNPRLTERLLGSSWMLSIVQELCRAGSSSSGDDLAIYVDHANVLQDKGCTCCRDPAELGIDLQTFV